jgi:drug/metabolite transporter (DMT)-like permease
VNPARSSAFLMLFFVAAIWGFAPPIIKSAFANFPPDLFLSYRFLLTCLVMIPILLLTEPQTWHTLSRLNASEWGHLALSGILGSTLQLSLLFWGLNLTTALDGSLINATSPVLVALAGVIILKEKITSRELTGLVIAFSGTLVIVLQPLWEGHRLFSGPSAGNLLVLAGTLSWVAYVILTKQELNHKFSPLLLTTNMFFVGLISMSLITLFLHSPITIQYLLFTAPLSSHLAVIYMAFLSGALAYWLYQNALKTIEVSEANIFLYLSPLFTIPLAHLWLGEPITAFFLAGSLMVASGVIIAELVGTRRRHVP